MRCDRGQSSLEYVALVAVVALVVAAAAWAGAPGAGDLGRQVTRELARALCVVRDGDCERDREPCVVRSRRSEDGWSATIAFVELGARWVGLVEQRSDGRWVVTRTRADDLGLSAGTGARGSLSLRGMAVAAGGEARMRALLGRAETLTWTLPTRAAAERLLGRLTADRVASASGSGLLRWIVDGTVELPAPDERLAERALLLGGEATAEARAGDDIGASVLLAAEDVLGRVRTDRGGTRTYVRLRGAAAGALAGGRMGGAGDAEAELVVAVEHDASGRALDLSVVETVALAGAAELPAGLSEVAGRLAPHGGGSGRRRRIATVERHLDLTVDRHRHAARRLLAAVAGGRSAHAAVGALQLRGLLERDGTAEVRTYETDEAEVSAGGVARLGPGLGAEAFHRRASSRLVGALSRGLDGRWVARGDCLAAA